MKQEINLKDANRVQAFELWIKSPMPMVTLTKELQGTNADGSTNFDYCQYCYKDGKFLQDCTMDEMIEHCAQFIDEVNKQMPKPMTRDEYVQMMRGFFPMLKRWRS